MKKTLLTIALGLTITLSQGQNLLTQNFDAIGDLAGWSQTNQSTPAGTNTWALPTTAVAAYFGGAAFNGTATSFGFANFNSTTGGTGIISNWLITPVVNLQNGDVISFYTRKGLSGGTTVYPDGMEMRLSTNGAATVLPTGGSAGLGDFTTLALAINPTLTTTGYPTTAWTQYTYTVTGLAAATDCKVAFRYLVTDAGPTGTKSDQIGIDAVSIDRPTAGTSQFFKNNFAMYPNPASNVINLSSATTAINAVELTDINGRTVKNITLNGVSETQINISDLNTGMYFLKIKSELGEGTAKIMKN